MTPRVGELVCIFGHVTALKGRIYNVEDYIIFIEGWLLHPGTGEDERWVHVTVVDRMFETSEDSDCDWWLDSSR